MASRRSSQPTPRTEQKDRAEGQRARARASGGGLRATPADAPAGRSASTGGSASRGSTRSSANSRSSNSAGKRR